MALTALSHALITALCGLVGLWFGSLNIGLALGLGFYFGREVAQHERKTRGTAIRGLFFWNWSLDAQLDMLFPLLSAIGLFMILEAL